MAVDAREGGPAPKLPTTAELQDLHDTALASVRGVRVPGCTAEELVRATVADCIARWALPLAKQCDSLVALVERQRAEIRIAHEMLDACGESTYRVDSLAKRIDSLDSHVDTTARAEERALLATKVEACAAALEAESRTDKGVRGAALREAAARVRAMVR